MRSMILQFRPKDVNPRQFEARFAAGTFHAIEVGHRCRCGRGWAMACHGDGAHHGDRRIEICGDGSARGRFHWLDSKPTPVVGAGS